MDTPSNSRRAISSVFFSHSLPLRVDTTPPVHPTHLLTSQNMSSISTAVGSAGEESSLSYRHPPKTGFVAGETTRMTPPSDNDPNNKTKNNKNKPPSYPTGATVPFPFATPYPQQVDLMESLLQGVKSENDGGDDNHHSTTKLVMLESPTGKLLSKQMVLSLSYFI